MFGALALLLAAASVSCFTLAAVRGTAHLVGVGVIDALAAACCFIARSLS
ncbi:MULTISPECIES: hypothetical protein [unclassified Methylobacterium]|nr:MULTISPECIES: hypothetical protein [unclassified Methylobacterium]